MLRTGKHIVLVIGVFFFSHAIKAQEDVASRETLLVEQQDINFQTFFFEALQQKAIGNFDKAVYALEACKNIDKDNVAVFFELSKNYALLIKFTEAEYYVLKGLEKEPSNIYMLTHLKEIKTKQNDYAGAILIQKRILKIKPEDEADLVILYIKSGDIDQAIILLKKLDSLKKLPERLVPLKESLLQENVGDMNVSNEVIPEEAPKTQTDLLKEDYALKKDYGSLKLLLEREEKTRKYLELLKDSDEGLSMFPAQPYLYLMNARALNSLRNYQKALNRLEEGLEYLIDDKPLMVDFLEEISLSYKGLGNNKMATQYFQKAMDLKNN